MSKSAIPWDELSPQDKKDHLDLYNLYDEKGFAYFYVHLFGMLHDLAYRILKGRTGYHEIANDCFVDIWKKKKKFRTPDLLRNYHVVAARNKCLNYLESTPDHTELPPDDGIPFGPEADPQRQIEAKECYILAIADIAKLSPRDKKIMEAKVEGKKNLEIARELNLSQQHIASIIAKIRKSLTKRFPRYR